MLLSTSSLLFPRARSRKCFSPFLVYLTSLSLLLGALSQPPACACAIQGHDQGLPDCLWDKGSWESKRWGCGQAVLCSPAEGSSLRKSFDLGGPVRSAVVTPGLVKEQTVGELPCFCAAVALGGAVPCRHFL